MSIWADQRIKELLLRVSDLEKRVEVLEKASLNGRMLDPPRPTLTAPPRRN